jgi:hypothetical protein
MRGANSEGTRLKTCVRLLQQIHLSLLLMWYQPSLYVHECSACMWPEGCRRLCCLWTVVLKAAALQGYCSVLFCNSLLQTLIF